MFISSSIFIFYGIYIFTPRNLHKLQVETAAYIFVPSRVLPLV